MRARGASALLALCLLAGCAPRPVIAAPRPPTASEWQRGLARLDALRAAAARARTSRIALDLREPHTGRVLSARGAVAVSPPRALRMILLGPGGTTALDLWVDASRFRFAVPAIDLQKRGDLSAPREERRGLPVDFLAFWLLGPLRGELLWYERTVQRGGTDRFVLRDGAAIVDLTASDDGRLEARRAAWSESTPPRLIEEETVVAGGLGCAEVRYHQGSTGLDVSVRCEGEQPGEPAARALADPDQKEAP
jgi:hypothetical protein